MGGSFIILPGVQVVGSLVFVGPGPHQLGATCHGSVQVRDSSLELLGGAIDGDLIVLGEAKLISAWGCSMPVSGSWQLSPNGWWIVNVATTNATAVNCEGPATLCGDVHIACATDFPELDSGSAAEILLASFASHEGEFDGIKVTRDGFLAPADSGSMDYNPSSLVYHPPAEWTPVPDPDAEPQPDESNNAQETDSGKGKSKGSSNSTAIITGVTVSLVLCAVAVGAFFVYRRRAARSATVGGKAVNSKSDSYADLTTGNTPPDSFHQRPVNVYEDPQGRAASGSVDGFDPNAVRIHASN